MVIIIADSRSSGSFNLGSIRFTLDPEDSRNEDFIVFRVKTGTSQKLQTLIRVKSSSFLEVDDYLEVLLVSRRRRIIPISSSLI